jgi:2-keto-4-pentenoate hydratase/2-oxohepta-3-ene-1,7-dioic acid hydratase in catechol pathway
VNHVRLCSYIEGGRITSGVIIEDRVVSLPAVGDAVGAGIPVDLEDAIRADALPAVREAVSLLPDDFAGRGRAVSTVQFLAPLRRPSKIWCIGLNYREHASALDERSPQEPASFMRPAISIRGPGDPICLPPDTARVTGEAELAVVIGRRCKYVSRELAYDVIAGIVPAIDMTAEDVLRRNPRFLTRAKSFDTFLSLGPWMATPDELGGREAFLRTRVTTLLNGRPEWSNTGDNMTHDVFDLIAFHSRVMTWEPGDVLLTGTPGAVVIRDGDVIGCEIEGLGRLENPVAQLPSDGMAPPGHFESVLGVARAR